MKKILILPLCLLMFSGAIPKGVEPQSDPQHKINAVPTNTKIDSINIKTAELGYLIRQL